MAVQTETRLSTLQGRMRQEGIDLVVVGPSANLRYVLGHAPVALERLTVLLVTPGDAVMVLPDFESAEFISTTGFSDHLTWSDRHGPAGAVTTAFDRLALPQGATVLIDDELPFLYLHRMWEGLGVAHRNLASSLLGSVRLIKGEDEIEWMAQVGELVSAAMDFAIEYARPGLTEMELKRAIEENLADGGADSLDFILVQAGANSAKPHHLADRSPLQANENVLFDIAVRMNGYASDITQQVYLGEPSEEYRRAYDVVFAAQEAGVQAARAGATAHAVAAAASAVILASEFAEWNGPSTGHGIGVDVHEQPRVVEDNSFVLPAGSVITIEPGVYIPGKFGIRIEDTVLVTDEGPRRLTRGSRLLSVKALQN